VFVYTRSALSERLSESSKSVALPNFISEKRFVRQTHALAVLLKRKYCLWGENVIINCECSAQNLAHLGSKATNRRRDSFPSGHDQRFRCQIFSNVHCLPPSTLLVVSYTESCYTKTSFRKVILYTHLILRHNISDAPQVDLKMFSFFFKKKSKKQFRNAHSMVITARIIS